MHIGSEWTDARDARPDTCAVPDFNVGYLEAAQTIPGVFNELRLPVVLGAHCKGEHKLAFDLPEEIFFLERTSETG